MTPKQLAIRQFIAGRHYTKLVLEHTPFDLWFQFPAGVTTHVAWQVGHITWATSLHVFRTIGEREDFDDGVLDARWGKLFGKGSEASDDASLYPAPAELTRVLDEQYTMCLAFLEEQADSFFDQPSGHSTGMIETKLDLLLYLSRHELLHVGQIGLIRRVLGQTPYR